jgi:deoxyribodipyrimidine photo-lyase
VQGKKFDSDGSYTRRFVPELDRLPNRYLFSPWEAPPGVLKEAEIIPGKTYPNPIVELGYSRQRALTAYAFTRKKT